MGGVVASVSALSPLTNEPVKPFVIMLFVFIGPPCM